jgi:hypothetical protein
MRRGADILKIRRVDYGLPSGFFFYEEPMDIAKELRELADRVDRKAVVWEWGGVPNSLIRNGIPYLQMQRSLDIVGTMEDLCRFLNKHGYKGL